MGTRMWDVIIIGSGISSLTCGLLLARSGKSVCVVERYAKPGGYLHCFERYGHRYDTGGHYSGALAEGQPFRVLLEHLGVYDDDLFVPLAESGFDVMRFRDFGFEMPRGYEALEAALCERFPHERVGIAAYLRLLRHAAESFATYNFARLGQDDDLIASYLETPLATVARRHVSDPKLLCILFAYCALHGVAPSDVSVGVHAVLQDSLLRGAWGFRGGGERLAERYQMVLERLGGELKVGEGVTRLLTEGRRINGVVLATGERLEAKTVISGIHPKATFRLLSDHQPSPAFSARLAGIEETIGLLGVYAVTPASETPLFARDRNYYFFDWDSPEGFDALKPGTGMNPERVLAAFVSRPDRVAGADSQWQPLSIHAPASFSWFAPWHDQVVAGGRKARSYYAFKLALGERVIAFVDSYALGTKAAIVKHDVSTPLSNLRFNGSEQGTAYGLYHAIRNTGARALGPRTHIENLLLTGQNALFPGLLGAAISGLRTAGNLVGIKNILKELAPKTRL